MDKSTSPAPLSGKIAIVTGASRGLGAASALWLAEQGAHVIAVARTIGGLEDLDDRIKAVGGQATLAPMDITDDGAIANLCRSVYDRWGRADIWVHAAIAVSPLTPAPHVQVKDLDKIVATNIRAVSRLISNVEPLIAPSDAPTAVFYDDDWDAKFSGPYGMSKAAQRALVQSWQSEAETTGAAVHLVQPKPMPTAVRARFYPGEDRTPLADPMAEAARLLAPILKT